MPKFRRNGRNMRGDVHYTPMAPYGVPSMPLVPPMYSVPSPMFVPPPMTMMVPPAANNNPPYYRAPRPPLVQSNQKQTQSNYYGPLDAKTAAEKACLQFFDSELLRTKDMDPTDLVIIDFDRTLLATPHLSLNLLNADSRDVLQYQVGLGKVWFQNPVVLDAAIEAQNWNQSLLQVARDASNTPNVLLVITTSRTSSEIGLIDETLKAQGVINVDHYACSSNALPDHYDEENNQEDNENNNDTDIEQKSEEVPNEEDAHENNLKDEPKDEGNVDGTKDENLPSNSNVHSFTMGSKAKYRMLELLMDTYTSVDRAYIFDRIVSDRKMYEAAVYDFVKDGWLSGENFFICPLVVNTFRLSPLQERELLTKVVKHIGLNLISCSSVSVQWSWRVNSESKSTLMTYFQQELMTKFPTMNIEDDVKFSDMECIIAVGSLPLEMRGLAAVRGLPLSFTVEGYEIDSLQRVHVRLISNRYKSFKVEIARIRNGFGSDVKHESITTPLNVTAYVYEKRELRVELRRPNITS